MTARPRAVGDPFDRRLGGAARNIEAGGKIERQVGRVGKAALQMGGETVARNHVEADAGKERHAGPLRLGVPRKERLEHVDLASDVEIMGPHAETPVGDRPRRGGKRAGGVEDDSGILQRGVEFCPIAEIERPPGQAERSRGGFQPVGVSACEHHARSPRARLPRDEPAGKAGRAVYEDVFRHFAALQPALRLARAKCVFSSGGARVAPTEG